MRTSRLTILSVAGMVSWAIPATAFCQDAKIQGWIGSLASEDFKARVEAQGQLLEWGRAHPAKAEELLLKEFSASNDPEVRMRLRESLLEIVISEHQKQSGQGYVGIQMMPQLNVTIPGVDGVASGVLVKWVVEGSPASIAGLKVNDVIVSLDHLRWNGDGAVEAFMAAIKGLKAGTVVHLEVLRGVELLKIPVTLVARPMGLPDRPPGIIPNGMIPNGLMIPAQPNPGNLEKLRKDAEEAFFKDWLEQKKDRRPRR